MTNIEYSLFVSRNAHSVIGISLLPNQVAIQIVPSENIQAVTEAIFDQAEIINLWVSTENMPADLTFPWDIIGFDNYPQQDGRWRFVLNCRSLEIVFLAAWPHITHNKS